MTNHDHSLLLCRVLFTAFLSACFPGTSAIPLVQQGPSLKLTSGEVCFGSRVKLVCTHPDPFDDPDKYLQIPITWAEDGTVIDFTDPASERFSPTRVNSTTSILSFDITEEHHRDRVIVYSCFLVIRNDANRDRDESEPLVLDPPENPSAPNITSLPDRDTDRMGWSYHTGCYGHHNFTFNLNWTRTDGPSNSSSSASAVTTDTQYIFSSLLRGEYIVSIQAQSVEDPSIVSEVVSINISLTHVINVAPCPTFNPMWSPTPAILGGPSTGLIAGIVVVCVVVILLTFLAGCGVEVIVHVVYQKKSKQSTRSTDGTFDEDKKNSPIPSYVNVELDNESIPMTTSPGYMQVERMTEGPKPLYGNL